MGEAKRRKDAIMQALLIAAKGDADLAEHMYQQQYRPQELAREMRKQGTDVNLALVSTDMNSSGHEVSCISCGRTAKMPFAPPPGQVVMCPDCQRSPQEGQP